MPAPLSSTPLRVLLIAVGSHGDINPYIALAAALKARGHEPTLMVNEYFHAQARDEGVDVAALGERIDLREILQIPGAMHPLRAPLVVLRDMVLPIVPMMVERTREEIRRIRPHVVLSHSICLGASWACEMEGVPRVACNLSPVGWFNANDPIVMSGLRSHTPSRRGVKFDLWLGRTMMNLIIDPPLNRLRRQMGLPRGKGWFKHEFTHGALALGLWSPQLRPSLPGDPAGSIITGFAWHDRHREITPEDDRLERFIRRCEGDGKPPVLFSLGTAAVHTAGDFYRHAADACALLDRPGLLLIGRNEYAPKRLPKNVECFTYAPFSTVMPRMAANVHHGGIGSTGQGMRASRPTVVVPLAHDQFDNAARVKRLGISETVPHAKLTPRRLADALDVVLRDPGYATRAAALRPHLLTEDGAARTIHELEARFGG